MTEAVPEPRVELPEPPAKPVLESSASPSGKSEGGEAGPDQYGWGV
jgi:hypothetical protein